MREIYQSVHKHGDLGIPLGCVIEVEHVGETADGPVNEIKCIAYGQGGTFSQAGIQGRLARDLETYAALFEANGDDAPPVKVRAVDLPAALMYIREHYIGPFDLFVEPATVIRLGTFDAKGGVS